MPPSIVTNICDSLFSQRNRLTTLKIEVIHDGCCAIAEILKALRVIAMNSAACTPLSDTSPTTKQRWS